MQNIASDRLRELLEHWKDGCLFFEEFHRLTKTQASLSPYLKNWRRLEDMIFDRHIQKLNPHDWAVMESFKNTRFCQAYGHVPFEFFEWNRKGRTATHLPRELQRPFSVAPFPKTRFADIELPFGSFVIVLEEPVQVQREDGSWGRFDALWVNSFGKKDRTTRCRLLRIPVAGTNAHRLPENAIRRCEIALRREGVSGFALEFNRQWKRWTAKVQEPPAEYAFPVFPTPVRDSDYVSDHIIPTNYRRVWDPTDRSSEEMDRVGQWTCSVAKIILGWCLYRKHMPSENYAWTEIPPQKRGARGQSTGVITDPAYICTILRIGTLDIGKYREQNLDDAGSNFFQWPHWRSGHWKRERGAGPRAQKTLWIDSYPVREDLMPLYGIHGGKLTNVEGELD